MRCEEFCGKVSRVADALDVDSALGRDGHPRDGAVPQAHTEPCLGVYLVVVNEKDLSQSITYFFEKIDH